MGMTCTRRLILGAAAGPAVLGPVLSASGAFAAPARLLFHVMHGTTKIGEHRIVFSGSGDEIVAEAEVSMLVKLGPITLLKYSHRASERWRAGRFESIETHTVANDKTARVTAKRTDAGVAIDSSTVGHAMLAANAAPATHWNLEGMRAPLFNPQDGKLVKETLARSRGSFAPPGTKTLATTRIVLSGEAALTDWYDASGAWLALRAKVKDGSFLDYVRV
jgi:Family of unknown function (DUF6134)